MLPPEASTLAAAGKFAGGAFSLLYGAVPFVVSNWDEGDSCCFGPCRASTLSPSSLTQPVEGRATDGAHPVCPTRTVLAPLAPASILGAAKERFLATLLKHEVAILGSTPSPQPLLGGFHEERPRALLAGLIWRQGALHSPLTPVYPDSLSLFVRIDARNLYTHRLTTLRNPFVTRRAEDQWIFARGLSPLTFLCSYIRHFVNHQCQRNVVAVHPEVYLEFGKQRRLQCSLIFAFSSVSSYFESCASRKKTTWTVDWPALSANRNLGSACASASALLLQFASASASHLGAVEEKTSLHRTGSIIRFI
eukprot:268713-Prorocentrum_minimum.AAC.2